MDERFDDICRLLSCQLTRRKTFQLVASGFAVGALSLVRPRWAAAAEGTAPRLCDPDELPGHRCGPPNHCCDSFFQCCTHFDSATCCPPGTDCCNPDKDLCCPTGTCCLPNNDIPNGDAGECCETNEVCCPFVDADGQPTNVPSGRCCVADGCCPDLAVRSFVRCCRPPLVCCSLEDGRRSGVCCAPGRCCQRRNPPRPLEPSSQIMKCCTPTFPNCCPGADIVNCCGIGITCCADCHGRPGGVCCDEMNGEKCCSGCSVTDCCPPGVKCCPRPGGGDSGVCCDEREGRECCFRGVTGVECCPKEAPCCRGRLEDAEGVCCDQRDGHTCCRGQFDAACCDPLFVCCPGLDGMPSGVCCDVLNGDQCCANDNGTVICCKSPKICIEGVCGLHIAYFGGGGGTFVSTTRAKSLLTVTISGEGVLVADGVFVDKTDIHATLSAYSYLTRTRVELEAFSLIQGNAPGTGNVGISGEGQARVNGVLTPITLEASNTFGVVTFEIRNRGTGTVLAGGTGEPGRSSLELHLN